MDDLAGLPFLMERYDDSVPINIGTGKTSQFASWRNLFRILWLQGRSVLTHEIRQDAQEVTGCKPYYRSRMEAEDLSGKERKPIGGMWTMKS